MNSEWRARYERGLEITRRAGDLALSHFDAGLEVELKGDQSPVTEADRATERLLREELARAFPQDGFLGEEYDDQPGASGFRWIIDPIDGTRSFVRNIPLWGTLVGLQHQDEIIAGIAYAPALGQMFHALRGEGAYRDDKRLRVSDVEKLDQSLITFTSVSWFVEAGKEQTFLELVHRTDRQRGIGDFYGFMLVAQGSCEAMCDHGCHLWDLAALQPIIEEAGGRFTTWEGTVDLTRPDVIASNGKIHQELVSILG